MSKYIIYALQDPFTFEIRYIGKSCSGLKRIKRHFNFNEQKNDKNKHKVNWINSLTRLPNILIIQTLNSNKELIQAECYWIDYFRKQNSPLLNISNGGEGQCLSDETKQKLSISIKNKLNDPSIKEKQINGIKQWCNSAEGKQSKSNATKNNWKNKEYRDHKSDSMKKFWSNDDYKKSISQKISKVKSKKVIDDLGNIYNSAKEAALINKTHPSAISLCINGKQKQANGRKFWRFE